MKKAKLLKRICAGVLTAGISLALVACAPGSAANGDSGTAAGGDASGTASGNQSVKIGVTVKNLRSNVYVMMQKSAEEKAQELGAELIFQACDYNAAVQKNQVETMLGQGINVLVIEPADAESMVTTLQMARDQGVHIINLEQRISNFDSDLWIVGDSYKVGQMQVEKFVEIWGEEEPANIVLLCGTKGDEIAESISTGVRETAAKYSNLEIIVDQQIAEWDRQRAMNYMEDAIMKADGKINAVLGNNDSIAMGAFKAAENAGLENDIWFIGADNDEENAILIMEGKQIMTIDKGAMLQGERIAEAAYMLATGETPPSDTVDVNVPVWLTPVQVVTQDNVEEIAGPKFPHLFA